MSGLLPQPQAIKATSSRSDRSIFPAERFILMLFGALGITALQMTFVLYWANKDRSIIQKYFSLNGFDSEWYAHIVNNGYKLTNFPMEAFGNNVAHVAFFPGFPAASWFLKILTGFSTELSLLVTAQLFTIGVWMYVLLFLYRYSVGWKLQSVAILSIFAFPSAFFLVAGYSESLFTFTLLGYLYWITDNHPKAWIFASIHGFFMSATRIVGIPLLILPVVRETLLHRKIPRTTLPYIVALCTGLGAGLFFLYCQSAFGEWNIYSHAQSRGWGVNPHFGAIFDQTVYKVFIPGASWDGFFDPDSVSRLSVPLIFIFALLVLACEIIAILRNPSDSSRIDHIIFCAAVGCMFFVTVSGLKTLGMRSVIRYMLPAHLILVLVAASMFAVFRHWNSWLARAIWIPFSIAIAILFFVQAGYVDLFSHGIWVA